MQDKKSFQINLLGILVRVLSAFRGKIVQVC